MWISAVVSMLTFWFCCTSDQLLACAVSTDLKTGSGWKARTVLVGRKAEKQIIKPCLWFTLLYFVDSWFDCSVFEKQ